MLSLHLREFAKNDLLKMQSLQNHFEACEKSASFPAAPKTAAPGTHHLLTLKVLASLYGVVAHLLAETAQYEK